MGLIFDAGHLGTTQSGMKLYADSQTFAVGDKALNGTRLLPFQRRRPFRTLCPS